VADDEKPVDLPPTEREPEVTEVTEVTETEREREPEPAPTPVDGSGDRLDRLENIVGGLVDIVAGLAPKDETPTKVPWTHRFGRNDR